MGLPAAFTRRVVMNAMKIVGIVLIVAGAAALAYGGFSYTKETHKAEIGPLKFSVQEKEQVNVPQWAGIGAIVLGVVLLVLPSKK
jgi:drug/metabolite transporter (DMT)-like permease